MKVSCGLELVFVFRLSFSIRISLGVIVHVSEGEDEGSLLVFGLG